MAQENDNQEQVLDDKDTLKGTRFYVTDLRGKGFRRLAGLKAQARKKDGASALFSCRYRGGGGDSDLS
jgi:hypothetical protein